MCAVTHSFPRGMSVRMRLLLPALSAVILSAPRAGALQGGTPPGPIAETPFEVVLPTKMVSAAGSTLTLESDGSIAVGGTLADKDRLTLECSIQHSGVTGFRLEAMTDERLPANGPGRAADGNFVLTEFSVLAAPKNSETFKPVPIGRA